MALKKKDFNKNKICRLLLKKFFLQENNNTTNKNHLFFEYTTNTLFEENTRKLEKKILIFRIGGLGSNILYQLAQIGFKNFVIIDDDIINLSDLNKNCLFNINDVGKKTIFLKHKIFRNFKINIKSYNKIIKSNSDIAEILNIESPEFVINSMDPAPSYSAPLFTTEDYLRQ